MELAAQLASLALKCVTGWPDAALGLAAGFLVDHVSDSSQRVNKALELASERAWKTLGISLSGPSWCDRFKNQDEQALRRQIQAFLESNPLPGLELQGSEFRQACLKELDKARKAKVIPGGGLVLAQAAEAAQRFARYTQPQDMVKQELQQVAAISAELQRAGYPHLGRFVGLCPGPGPYPLLVIAVRFFFRREIENDPRLASTWQFHQFEGLTQGQETGFRQLHDAIQQHSAKIEQRLDEVFVVLTQTHEVVTDTHEVVSKMQDDLRVIKAQLERMETQQRGTAPQTIDIFQAVLHVVQALQGAATGGRLGLAVPVVPLANITSSHAEPAPPMEFVPQVKRLVTRLQAMPKQQQRQLPELFRVVGRLKAAVGSEETRTRLFPQLAVLGIGQPRQGIPASPRLSARTGDSSGSNQPRLMHIQGQPISPLFQTPPEETTAAEAESVEAGSATAPAPRKREKRLFSKLFDEPQE